MSQVATAITPVPGGVGPMTIALLLRNTLQAARAQAGIAMSLRRLRLGELIALAGAICVIVSLFERWYENADGNLSAWEKFGRRSCC